MTKIRPIFTWLEFHEYILRNTCSPVSMSHNIDFTNYLASSKNEIAFDAIVLVNERVLYSVYEI